MARPALTADQVQAFRTRATQLALQLFATGGYDQFSLRTLARELGCSHATPYRYFAGGKSEIFASVRAEGFSRFAAALRDSQRGTNDPAQALRQMARAYIAFSVEQRAAFAVIFQMGQPRGQDAPEVTAAAADAWSVLLDGVRAAIEANALAGDLEEVAHTLWAGLHGVASLESARKLGMGRPAPAVLTSMVDALFRAHRPEELPDG